MDEFEASGLGDLGQVLGFNVRLAHGRIYRHFSESFGALDLTQKQVSVLWLIGDRPGVAQADLGRLLQIDRATVMGMVNRLQGRGLLVRGRSRHDARRQTLDLTPAGHQTLVMAREAIGAHEAWLRGRFSAAEVDTLIALLARIHSPA